LSEALELRLGARGSQLSRIQSESACAQLRRYLPHLHLELVPMSSPGDRDRRTDLRESPPDFFTRFLDDALREGELDGAIHSAKDLPEPVPADLDWFWLPWPEDRRDVVVLAPGMAVSQLPPEPVCGVSSERRADYCRERFPGARLEPIRGNIESRLAQLDRGDYDVLVTAAAALHRLDLRHRINEYIPLAELATPPGQGYLALTFRAGDARFRSLRTFCVPAVVLAGAGPGEAGLLTVAARAALARAEVCLYDLLIPEAVLALLPEPCERVAVGRRGADKKMSLSELEQTLQDRARRAQQVVRLKGGDPGVFGRLASELQALGALDLPWRVIPGVSSLAAATSGRGMPITRRGGNRELRVFSPQFYPEPTQETPERPAPAAVFMALSRLPAVLAELARAGHGPDTPVQVVFAAGDPLREEVVAGTLADIAEVVGERDLDKPALFLAGQIANASLVPGNGALLDRVLLSCSEALQEAAAWQVRSHGGRPVCLPLIELSPEPEVLELLRRLQDFDWLTLTSPSAARCLLRLLREQGVDVRELPRLVTSGPGVSRVLAEAGLRVAAEPDAAYSAGAMLATVEAVMRPGDRVLRLRSDQAPTTVAETLRQAGMDVTEAVLYRNRRAPLPEWTESVDFQAVLRDPVAAVVFASGSAVDAFVAHWGTAPLHTLRVAAIGAPTARVLARHGVHEVLVAPEATIPETINALAAAALRW